MKKHIKLYFVFCFVIIFNSCSDNSGPQEKLGGLAKKFYLTSENQGNCEDKVFEQFEQKKIQFAAEAQFDSEIAKANQLLVNDYPVEFYVVDETNGQIQEIKKTKSTSNNATYVDITFMVGLNQKGSLKPMYFEITAEQGSSVQKSNLVQRFSVDRDCNLKLSRTTLSDFSLVNGKSIHYESKTISDHEVIEEVNKDHTIPEGKVSTDFLRTTTPKEAIEALKSSNRSVFLIPRVGFVDIEMQELPSAAATAFGKEFQFERWQVTLLKNNKPLVNLITQFDPELKAQLTDYVGENKKSWVLPKEFKSQISLGQAQLGASYFESELSSDYQIRSGKYLLKTNKAFPYPHLEGYYKTSFIGENNGLKSFIMDETRPPLYADTVVPADLEVNSTIQSDLPEIQKISQTIALKSSDRKQQISEILKYLASNYAYDYDMVEKEKVRPLTTREALDRKKGVCQHYAVLFTALARALKIPSRIIMGYLIAADKPGMHAWVEAEIEPNRWQVIEPQMADGLTQTLPRFYFPLSRATFLENKNAEFADSILALINLKLIALPIH